MKLVLLSRLTRTDRPSRTLIAVQVISGASTGGMWVMRGAEAQAEPYQCGQEALFCPSNDLRLFLRWPSGVRGWCVGLLWWCACCGI